MTRGQFWVPWFNTTLRPQWHKAYGQRQRCTCFQNQVCSVHKWYQYIIVPARHGPKVSPNVFWWPSASATKLFDFSLCGAVFFFNLFSHESCVQGLTLLFWAWAIRCRDAKKLTSIFLQAPSPLANSPVWTLISSNFFRDLFQKGKQPISFRPCLTKVENYL